MALQIKITDKEGNEFLSNPFDVGGGSTSEEIIDLGELGESGVSGTEYSGSLTDAQLSQIKENQLSRIGLGDFIFYPVTNNKMPNPDGLWYVSQEFKYGQTEYTTSFLFIDFEDKGYTIRGSKSVGFYITLSSDASTTSGTFATEVLQFIDSRDSHEIFLSWGALELSSQGGNVWSAINSNGNKTEIICAIVNRTSGNWEVVQNEIGGASTPLYLGELNWDENGFTATGTLTEEQVETIRSNPLGLVKTWGDVFVPCAIQETEPTEGGFVGSDISIISYNSVRSNGVLWLAISLDDKTYSVDTFRSFELVEINLRGTSGTIGAAYKPYFDNLKYNDIDLILNNNHYKYTGELAGNQIYFSAVFLNTSDSIVASCIKINTSNLSWSLVNQKMPKTVVFENGQEATIPVNVDMNDLYDPHVILSVALDSGQYRYYRPVLDEAGYNEYFRSEDDQNYYTCVMNDVGDFTWETIPKGGASKKYSITIASTAWAGSSAPYTYTITAATHGCGVRPLVTIWSDTAPYEQYSTTVKSAANGDITIYSNVKIGVIVDIRS